MDIRLPHGFLENLGDVINKHDAEFLAELCREFNVPFRNAKMKILGLGKQQNVTVSEKAWNEKQQCIFWVRNPATNHWRHCPSRQIPGFACCENHFGYLNNTSKYVKRREDIKDAKQMSWLRIDKQLYLWDATTGKVWTGDDKPTKYLATKRTNGKVIIQKKE